MFVLVWFGVAWCGGGMGVVCLFWFEFVVVLVLLCCMLPFVMLFVVGMCVALLLFCYAVFCFVLVLCDVLCLCCVCVLCVVLVCFVWCCVCAVVCWCGL